MNRRQFIERMATPPITPETLRQRRHRLGLEQAELAELLGVSANTVSRWELGKLTIANPRLLALAIDALLLRSIYVRVDPEKRTRQVELALAELLARK
jgi:transcriptional regulator with XRE-family HTH domain